MATAYGMGTQLIQVKPRVSDICSPCGFHPPALLVNAEHLLFLCYHISDVKQTETVLATLELLTRRKFIT